MNLVSFSSLMRCRPALAGPEIGFLRAANLAGGVVPDIISLAKSLGSGVPVGACLVNEKVSSHIKENDLGTTFGGGMLAMAAVLATLEAIEQDDMIANAAASKSI